MQGELLRRARSGDDVAFEELVRPHHRELQAHCYRILGSAADAEDAFQATFLALLQGARSIHRRNRHQIKNAEQQIQRKNYAQYMSDEREQSAGSDRDEMIAR